MIAELFHVDGRTDKTKLTVAFRNFANAPNNERDFTTLSTTMDVFDVKKEA